MARKMTEWPSKRGPITKIMPSDGCIGDTVPLAVGKWYDFHEFGWYMGNVGQGNKARSKVRARVEHVFGAQSNDMGGTLVRSIGLARATVRIGLKNLAYNMRRLVQLERLAMAGSP